MPKIQFNPADQQISVSGKIGRGGEATVKLDPEVQEVGINLGIIELGATTDYGGAVTLGIAGQSVTLGTQGGEINLGVGGFEVKVEARDCIVTEEKFIFGNLVASRTYRDPGCGPEEEADTTPPPPTPTPTPTPTPGSSSEIPNTEELMWVIIDLIDETWRAIGYGQLRLEYTNTFTRTITEQEIPVPPSDPPTTSLKVPFTLTETQTDYPNTIHKIPKSSTNTPLRLTQITLKDNSYRSASFVTSKLMSTNGGSSFFSPLIYGANYARSLCFYGTGTIIKGYMEYHEILKKEKLASLAAQGFNTASILTFKNPRIILLMPRKNKPFLPTGNKPPMNECCEEVLDILEDFKDAIGIDRLLKDKFPVSNTFMAPECDPASKTEAKDLYEIIQCLFRVLAHGLIFEPRVAIKDADAAKAGDQEFKTRYLNATGWASAMAEAMLEVKDDGNVSTNMDIRNGFAATQTMVGVADALIRLDAILDCLGITLMPRVEEIQTPYNCFVKIGKGFGEGNERELDLNQDEATEKLLPDFLKTKINKIKTVEIHPRSESLLEILQRIESNLPPQSNG